MPTKEQLKKLAAASGAPLTDADMQMLSRIESFNETLRSMSPSQKERIGLSASDTPELHTGWELEFFAIPKGGGKDVPREELEAFISDFKAKNRQYVEDIHFETAHQSANLGNKIEVSGIKRPIGQSVGDYFHMRKKLVEAVEAKGWQFRRWGEHLHYSVCDSSGHNLCNDENPKGQKFVRKVATHVLEGLSECLPLVASQQQITRERRKSPQLLQVGASRDDVVRTVPDGQYGGVDGAHHHEIRRIHPGPDNQRGYNPFLATVTILTGSVARTVGSKLAGPVEAEWSGVKTYAQRCDDMANSPLAAELLGPDLARELAGRLREQVPGPQIPVEEPRRKTEPEKKTPSRKKTPSAPLWAVNPEPIVIEPIPLDILPSPVMNGSATSALGAVGEAAASPVLTRRAVTPEPRVIEPIPLDVLPSPAMNGSAASFWDSAGEAATSPIRTRDAADSPQPRTRVKPPLSKAFHRSNQVLAISDGVREIEQGIETGNAFGVITGSMTTASGFSNKLGTPVIAINTTISAWGAGYDAYSETQAKGGNKIETFMAVKGAVDQKVTAAALNVMVGSVTAGLPGGAPGILYEGVMDMAHGKREIAPLTLGMEAARSTLPVMGAEGYGNVSYRFVADPAFRRTALELMTIPTQLTIDATQFVTGRNITRLDTGRDITQFGILGDIASTLHHPSLVMKPKEEPAKDTVTVAYDVPAPPIITAANSPNANIAKGFEWVGSYYRKGFGDKRLEDMTKEELRIVTASLLSHEVMHKVKQPDTWAQWWKDRAPVFLGGAKYEKYENEKVRRDISFAAIGEINDYLDRREAFDKQYAMGEVNGKGKWPNLPVLEAGSESKRPAGGPKQANASRERVA